MHGNFHVLVAEETFHSNVTCSGFYFPSLFSFSFARVVRAEELRVAPVKSGRYATHVSLLGCSALLCIQLDKVRVGNTVETRQCELTYSSNITKMGGRERGQ